MGFLLKIETAGRSREIWVAVLKMAKNPFLRRGIKAAFTASEAMKKSETLNKFLLGERQELSRDDFANLSLVCFGRIDAVLVVQVMSPVFGQDVTAFRVNASQKLISFVPAEIILGESLVLE